MQLRPAHADEIATLDELAIRSKAYWGYADEFLEACRIDLAIPASMIEDGRVFVADADGTIAGFVSLVGGADELELGHLFVEPAHVRSGVGRQLFELATEEAARRGAVHLVIESDPHAEGFYLGLGAERVGSRVSAVDAGRRNPLLKYRLR